MNNRSTKVIFRVTFITLFTAMSIAPVNGQLASRSEDLAATVMKLWKDSWSNDPARPERWSYEEGVALKGMESGWQNTGDDKYFNFIQQSIDRFLNDDG